MIRQNKFLRLILSVSLILVLFASCTFNAFAEIKIEENPEIPPPKKVSISFNTMGGSECEAIYGYASETEITEDMLPTPTKEGHTFKGWRHFNEYGMPFELTVFPNYDITLFADFDPNGFSATFEEGISEIYDINSGIELYAPDTKKYSRDMVKEGWRCIRTKKISNTSPMFLLSYHNALEVGKEYEFIIHIKAEKSGAKGSVDFLYTENPDIRDEPIGYHKAFDLVKTKNGEWKEYKIKFVAAAPYVIVRMPNISGLYIDDIKVENTGATGEIPELKKADDSKNPLSSVIIVVVSVGLLAVAILFILRRKHNNK